MESSAAACNTDNTTQSSNEAAVEGQKDESVVTWLYPGAPSRQNKNAKMSDVANPETSNGATEMEAKTSSSSGDGDTGGPDSDVGSVDELPIDSSKDKEGTNGDDIGHKVSGYFGSMLSSAWSKTAKTANDATANSSTFLTSAITKVTGSTSAKPSVGSSESAETSNPESPTSSEEKNPVENAESSSISAMTTSMFTSAISNLGFAAKAEESESTSADEQQAKEDGDQQPKENGGQQKGAPFDLASFGTAFSTLSKVAVDATQTIKEKVGTGNMLSEFNKEQDTFIKSKGSNVEAGVCPWVGYQNEDDLKAKILSVSEDRRNFVRAPPSGVTFEFEYSSVSATALALLQEDDRLQKMRYELVPKQVKEEEFWRNYFYRVSLIKQSFELTDLEDQGVKTKSKSASNSSKKSRSNANSELQDDMDMGVANEDDEFVSDSYQASTSDLAEADETIKKLGVAGDAEEWEAELEGELNEFEVVKDEGEDNTEWEESQIQELLDAEEAATAAAASNM